MCTPAMRALLLSFVPHLECVWGLEVPLLAGDPEATIACARRLMADGGIVEPSTLQRLHHERQDKYVGPVFTQYILLEEIIAAIESLQKEQAQQPVVVPAAWVYQLQLTAGAT